MKIIAVNGSPRKDKNTATMLKKALEGAKFAGAETKLVHLYDLKFQGCTSCFACKLKGYKNPGLCAVKDDLKSLFQEIRKADAVIFGTPIYFMNMSGEMLCMLERMEFAALSYNEGQDTVYPEQLRSAFIYTMNMPKEMVQLNGVQDLFDTIQKRMERLFQGPSEYLMSCETLQFDDYSQYESGRFDAEREKKSMKPNSRLIAKTHFSWAYASHRKIFEKNNQQQETGCKIASCFLRRSYCRHQRPARSTMVSATTSAERNGKSAGVRTFPASPALIVTSLY
jgi:multimeric flavodoxin WrbA